MFEGAKRGDGGILHVVAFRWVDGTPRSASAVLEVELRGMAEELPSIMSYRCGADLELLEGSWDFAVVAAVRSPEDLRAYLGDERHARITATRVTPMLAQRVAVQIPISSADHILALA